MYILHKKLYAILYNVPIALYNVAWYNVYRNRKEAHHMNHSKKKVSPGLLAMFGVSEAEAIEALEKGAKLAEAAERFQHRPMPEQMETESEAE